MIGVSANPFARDRTGNATTQASNFRFVRVDPGNKCAALTLESWGTMKALAVPLWPVSLRMRRALRQSKSGLFNAACVSYPDLFKSMAPMEVGVFCTPSTFVDVYYRCKCFCFCLQRFAQNSGPDADGVHVERTCTNSRITCVRALLQQFIRSLPDKARKNLFA